MRSPQPRFATLVLSGALALAACGETPTDPLADALEPAAPSLAVLAGAGSTLDGNPTCTDLGYAFGFKIDGFPRADLTDGRETYTVAWGGYTFGTVTLTSADQVTFSWSSDFGIDGVIAKGGPAGQLFRYDNATGDAGLHSPERANKSGKVIRPALSHVDFCFGLEVDASKTAETSFTRDHDWSITKTAEASSVEVAAGASRAMGYTVTVAPSGSTDSDWGVAGTITVRNPTPFPATITSLSDVMTGGITAAVDCTLPFTLAAGASASCRYGASLPDAATRTNTVLVATDPSAVYGPGVGGASYGNGLKVYGSGSVRGASGTAPVVFGAPTKVLDATVTLNDDLYAGLAGVGTVGLAGGRYTYSLDLAADCADGSRVVTNTASYEGSAGERGSASASVTVNTTGCDAKPPVDPDGDGNPGDDSGAHETAYAFGGWSFCAVQPRWGWANVIDVSTSGSVTRPIYAGAGQCDVRKGTLVGTTTISWEVAAGQVRVTVTHQASAGRHLDATHTWIGFDLPGNLNANGNFTVVRENKMVSSDTATHTLTLGGKTTVYVIAHMEAGGL